MYQINSGLKRGYEESEIVDAVICAISPHSSLRSYVETLSDLSLAKLRRILRVHYRHHLGCTDSLQPYANKAMNHHSNSYSVLWACVIM